MSKHTEGCWVVGKNERFEAEKKQPIFYVYKPGYRSICELSQPGTDKHGIEDPEEREANARLIACAPKLLIACKLALSSCDPHAATTHYIEAIIAQAEGTK